MKKVRALGLLSGGLDSTLAVKLILDQGIEVKGVKFTSPFCLCDKSGKCFAALTAQKLNIPLKFIAKGEEYLSLVKKPKFGYGSGCNPCLDCRVYMFKRTKELAHKLGAKFIFTGEVLGQRPMSQHLRAMKLIDREAGLVNQVLRPLSALLLEPTEAEKNGWVKREKLLKIQGRSRKEQIKLAEKFQINDYPCAAGGCLLTDRIFSQRLREMFQNWPDCSLNDVELLKNGRIFWYKTLKNTNINTKKHECNSGGHFRVPRVRQPADEGYAFGCLIVVGRNHEENLKIKKLAKRDDILVELKDIPGPTTLIRGKKISKKTIDKAKKLTKKYAKKATGKKRIIFKTLTK